MRCFVVDDDVLQASIRRSTDVLVYRIQFFSFAPSQMREMVYRAIAEC